MNKNIVSIFLFIFSIAMIHSVNARGNSNKAKLDSLHQILNTQKGSAKIVTQLELALIIKGKDLHEAQQMAQSALLKAQSLGDRTLEMRAYLTLGKIGKLIKSDNLSTNDYDSALIISDQLEDNWYKGEIIYEIGTIYHSYNKEIEALKYFNAALQACRLSNNYKVMGSTYSMMGIIFRIEGIYDRAIEYTINAKLNYEKAGFREGKPWNDYLLGCIYADLKLPQKALEYFHEALKTYLQLASIDGKMEGVAICYEQIGLLNLGTGNFQEAHDYFTRTLNIYTDSHSQYGRSNSFKNLGMIEYSIGNYEQAENYLNESLTIKNDLGEVLSLPTIYEYIGLCLIEKGEKEEGFNKLKQGLDIAISNNQKKIQLNIYSKLTELYLKNKDLRQAFHYQKKQTEIQDSILSGTANIKMEQLQAIYELDKKNSQIIELKNQNAISALTIKQNKILQFIIIVGIIIALFITIYTYWFYKKIKQKNLELKATNAAKDKFFAIIAHDLRGPIGSLTSFLEQINESFNEFSQEELREVLLLLHKSSENVSGLLENLLKWAQSQLNNIELHPTDLKLSEVIHNSIKGLLQTAESKQVEIKFELNDQISVWADLNMVQTIIRNLLSNAIKFTHRGGLVIIRTNMQNKNDAIISIIDHGVGIDPSSIQKIFDISNKIHTKGTENEQSTGLGLILVKDFIEKNNGTITIESQINKGTTVTFTLPTTQ